MKIIKETFVLFILCMLEAVIVLGCDKATHDNVREQPNAPNPLSLSYPKNHFLIFTYSTVTAKSKGYLHLTLDLYSKNTSSVIFLDKPGLIRTKKGALDSHPDLKKTRHFVRKHQENIFNLSVFLLLECAPGKTDLSPWKLLF